jgi:hypothetical protein
MSSFPCRLVQIGFDVVVSFAPAWSTGASRMAQPVLPSSVGSQPDVVAIASTTCMPPLVAGPSIRHPVSRRCALAWDVGP